MQKEMERSGRCVMDLTVLEQIREKKIQRESEELEKKAKKRTSEENRMYLLERYRYMGNMPLQDIQ